MTTQPPLREVIARYGLAAKRSLGQHFLLDANLTGRIVRAAGPLHGVHVIEIGPGPGGLTRALLGSDAASITAVEVDPRAVEAMGELSTQADGRLRVIAGDALALDVGSLTPEPRQIVANLPYNIATPLLVMWLRQARAFERLTLMFQQEVADRICATPGTAAYGRLTVLELKASVDLHLPMRSTIGFALIGIWIVGSSGPAATFRASRCGPIPRGCCWCPLRSSFTHPRKRFCTITHPSCVERIGLGVEWRRGLAVMFRLTGAQRPR